MDIPSTSLRIFLLGRFGVTRGERILQASAWTRRKAAALLQRLALERRLLKDQAIEFLWPEVDPQLWCQQPVPYPPYSAPDPRYCPWSWYSRSDPGVPGWGPDIFTPHFPR